MIVEWMVYIIIGSLEYRYLNATIFIYLISPRRDMNNKKESEQNE
jgi:hypothetical protein